MRVGGVDIIHQSAVANSMHLQSTYTPHLQYLQSEARLESSRKSAVELSCRNSQLVNPNLGGLFFFLYMNIVHTNKYNKKLQSPGALNIKETPGYNKKIM